MNGQAVANVGGYKLLRVWRMEDGGLQLDDPLRVLFLYGCAAAAKT